MKNVIVIVFAFLTILFVSGANPQNNVKDTPKTEKPEFRVSIEVICADESFKQQIITNMKNELEKINDVSFVDDSKKPDYAIVINTNIIEAINGTDRGFSNAYAFNKKIYHSPKTEKAIHYFENELNNEKDIERKEYLSTLLASAKRYNKDHSEYIKEVIGTGLTKNIGMEAQNIILLFNIFVLEPGRKNPI